MALSPVGNTVTKDQLYASIVNLCQQIRTMRATADQFTGIVGQLTQTDLAEITGLNPGDQEGQDALYAIAAFNTDLQQISAGIGGAEVPAQSPSLATLIAMFVKLAN